MLNLVLLSDIIDKHIMELLNKNGSSSFLERNLLVSDMLQSINDILKEYQIKIDSQPTIYGQDL